MADRTHFCRLHIHICEKGNMQRYGSSVLSLIGSVQAWPLGHFQYNEWNIHITHCLNGSEWWMAVARHRRNSLHEYDNDVEKLSIGKIALICFTWRIQRAEWFRRNKIFWVDCGMTNFTPKLNLKWIDDIDAVSIWSCIWYHILVSSVWHSCILYNLKLNMKLNRFIHCIIHHMAFGSLPPYICWWVWVLITLRHTST